jgi:hypothetical protein
MTILEVKNQLITHFLSQDTFEFNRHQLMVTFDKETADFREGLLKAALAELEALAVVKRMVVDEREVWVLVQPMTQCFMQQVTIGPLVAEVIANTVNFIREAEGIDTLCDKTKIGELDLLFLVKKAEECIAHIEADDDEEND